MDNVGVREAFPRAIRVLEDITKSDKVSIYSLTDAKLFAILAAKSDKKEFIAPATLKIKDRQDIQQVIETKDIFINKDFLSHLPVMTAPIIHKNEVIAIVAIHSIPFENLNLYHHNRLKVAVNIISYCITKAYSHLGEFKQVYVYTSRGS